MKANQPPELSISIVSHRQGGMVAQLLHDIGKHCREVPLEVILTLNMPEPLSFDPASFPFPVRTVCNESRKGFGQNHNAAFQLAHGRYFCVLNPDVRLQADPFPRLLAELGDGSIGMVAPRIVDERGRREDSARNFPTPGEILKKLLGGRSSVYQEQKGNEPDWLAGMFLVFPCAVFRELRGFDERYFMYYEDVDICVRLRLAGYRIRLCDTAFAIHGAQRSSHRNLRHLGWHVTSMLRFFLSEPRRRIMRTTRT